MKIASLTFILSFILSLMIAGPTAYGGNTCGSLFQSSGPNHAETRMIELGFDPSVANRILVLRPDIAKMILERKDDTARAEILFRGMGIPLDRYQPVHEGNFSETFFSKSIEDAILYASRYGENNLSYVDLVAQKRTLGTILKIQLPAFLFQNDIPGSFFPEAKLVERSVIANFTPFIFEIGIVDVTYSRAEPGFLRWYKFDEIDFRKTHD